jgi:hypothetical protein
MQVTISERMEEALRLKGQDLELRAPDYLKFVLQAATLPGGIHLKLDLPPLPAGDLPLLEAAGVSLEA